MAEVKFISKFAKHKIYVGKKKAVFSNGKYSTSDQEIIEGLRKATSYGVQFFEDKQPLKPIVAPVESTGVEEGSASKEIEPVAQMPVKGKPGRKKSK